MEQGIGCEGVEGRGGGLPGFRSNLSRPNDIYGGGIIA